MRGSASAVQQQNGPMHSSNGYQETEAALAPDQNRESAVLHIENGDGSAWGALSLSVELPVFGAL